MRQELRNGKWVPKGTGYYERQWLELSQNDFTRLQRNDWDSRSDVENG